MIEATNRSRIPCTQHPSQQITNYCCNLQCLRPLCPDCVQVHTKSHSKQQIQSWKHCLYNTSSQLKNTFNRLQVIQSRLGSNPGGRTIEAIEQQAIRNLDNLRKQIHQLVDEAFNHHEREIRNIVRNEFRSNTIDLSRLRAAIEQIQKLIMKLANNNTVIPALKKSLLLDHQSLIAHFEQEYRNSPQKVMRQEFLLNINQQNILKLKRNIQRLISYDNTQIQSRQFIPYPTQKQELMYTPKVYQDQRVNYQPPNRNQKQLIVSKQNYFTNTHSQYLHYFVPNSNKLKLLHVSNLFNEAPQWKTVKLVMNGEIPSFYKSIITPSGEIYLIGGIDKSNQKKNEIYIYNSQKYSLELVARMVVPRSSHAVCYMNGNIYIVGGFKQSPHPTTVRECEVFSIQNRNCFFTGELTNPCANCSVSSFNNQYMFKFGGITDNGQPSKNMEVYSVRDNRWSVIDPQFHLGWKYTDRFWINSFSAAVQINTNEIFIFGGYNNYDNQESSQMSYTLHVEKRGADNVYSIRNIGVYQLPQAEGFWDNNPLIINNNIVALQNVSDGNGDGMDLILDQRRIIVFNGNRWSVL